jgi:hypothetical protein
MQWLDLLDTSLNEAELTALSRQLAVSFAAFPGRTKRDRTREFLGYVGRQGRDAGLAEALVALRPDLATAVANLFAADDPQLAWLDQVGGAGQRMESGVTWRWPTAGDAPGRPLTAQLEAAPDDPMRTAILPAQDVAAPAAAAVAQPAPNPYTPGRKISAEGMFFGRQAEQTLLQEQLTGGGHVAIVAARTFGASSLLAHAARQAAAPQLAAYADLKDPALHTLPGLLNSIWGQWWAGVKPGSAAVVRTLGEFAVAARKLHAAGFRPLLFLDELEQLVWRPGVFGDDLLDAWLALGREGAVGLALTAHAAPAELLAQAGYRSRFYELFRQIDLGLLDAAAARALLTAPSERAGLIVPDEAADELLAQAGPHPFYLHLAGHYLFEALTGVYSTAEAWRRFQAAATPPWQELWDSLSPLAQSHYPTLPTRSASGMAARQLRLLANRGLVIADGSGFRPFSDGFATWVRRLRAAVEAAADVQLA